MVKEKKFKADIFFCDQKEDVISCKFIKEYDGAPIYPALMKNLDKVDVKTLNIQNAKTHVVRLDDSGNIRMTIEPVGKKSFNARVLRGEKVDVSILELK